MMMVQLQAWFKNSNTCLLTVTGKNGQTQPIHVRVHGGDGGKVPRLYTGTFDSPPGIQTRSSPS